MSAAPQVGMLIFNCNKRFLPALNLKLLHRQTQSIMRLAHLQKFDLSVDFVGNRAMQILNRKHRGKDVPTDVLSFPAFQVRRRACSFTPLPAGKVHSISGDFLFAPSAFQIKAGHAPPEAIEAIGESWDMGKIVLSVPYIFEQCVELDSNLEARYRTRTSLPSLAEFLFSSSFVATISLLNLSLKSLAQATSTGRARHLSHAWLRSRDGR